MIRTPKAKQVLTKAELELYLKSLPRTVGTHNAYRLKQKVARTRKLRNKYVAEAKRQAREARGKAKAKGARAAQGNERTVLKGQIFSEMLERYEAALKAAPKPAAKKKKAAPGAKKKVKKKAAKKPAAKKKAKAKKKPAAKKKAKAKKKSAKKKAVKRPASWSKTGRKKAAKKKARRKVGGVAKSGRVSTSKSNKARYTRSGSKRAGGHVSSRTRRNQAKRDSR